MQAAQQSAARRHGIGASGYLAAALAAGLALLSATPASAATLDRVRQAGKLVLGYRADARPFSFDDGSGKPSGYSIALCQNVAEEVKKELAIPDLKVEWVPVTVDDRFSAIEQGKIDLLCSASTATLERRKTVSFSIPVYSGGVAAMLRSDAPRALQDVLAGRPPSGPIWRGSPAQILTDKTFSVVSGTTAQSWLERRLNEFQLTAQVVPVESYDAGTASVLAGTTDVLFGDRSILVESAAANPSAADLTILDRLFTSEPIALALARNDDDFRLVVDRALSRYFASDEFRNVYSKWFGAPDDGALSFFRQTALPD
jgi:polar amino acid transport system substrate-binding protein